MICLASVKDEFGSWMENELKRDKKAGQLGGYCSNVDAVWQRLGLERRQWWRKAGYGWKVCFQCKTSRQRCALKMVTGRKGRSQRRLICFCVNKLSGVFHWHLINPKYSKTAIRPFYRWETQRRCATCLIKVTHCWATKMCCIPKCVCPQTQTVTVHHTQRCVSEARVEVCVYCWGEREIWNTVNRPIIGIWPFNNWSQALTLPKIRPESLHFVRIRI